MLFTRISALHLDQGIFFGPETTTELVPEFQVCIACLTCSPPTPRNINIKICLKVAPPPSMLTLKFFRIPLSQRQYQNSKFLSNVARPRSASFLVPFFISTFSTFESLTFFNGRTNGHCMGTFIADIFPRPIKCSV